MVSNFLVQAMRGEPLTVYGDGKQTRSFCYVDDEVRGLLALLDSDHVGPMNIGNPDEFTMLELAELVLEVTGASVDAACSSRCRPTTRRSAARTSRSPSEVLGWHPTVDLREGLARTHDWYRRHGGIDADDAARYRKLSVIVPVYNERNTVVEIVRRMRAVELPVDLEIIVVDDGSTDGTRDVLRQLADSTVRVITHERTGARARRSAPGSSTSPATSC